MKPLIFLAVFFSGIFLFSANSTENRQKLWDLEISSKLKSLKNENNLISSLAYNAYVAFSLGDPTPAQNNEEIIKKLCDVGLAEPKGDAYIFVEYYVSDELPKLARAEKSNKRK